MSLTTPPTAIDLLRERCNRLVNGECSLRKCMVRGGWTGGETNYDKATCEYREAVLAMEENRWLHHHVRHHREAAEQLHTKYHEARAALGKVMDQAENDLASAHAEICKLQGVDPEKHDWPAWSPQANSLRWFSTLRDEFDLGPEEPAVVPKAEDEIVF